MRWASQSRSGASPAAREVVSLPTWDLLDGHVVGADVLEALAAIPDCSVDSVVCDPPYGIGFMGHEWDQPGEFGPVRSNGNPSGYASGRPAEGPHVAGGAAALQRHMARAQRRGSQRSPATGAGHASERERARLGMTGDHTTTRERGGAMHAGRYDLSPSANRRYQAWCEAWARECWRVLKPGGHLLASCGTRTYHRLAAGVEDAGFEIRDRVLTIRADEGGELDWLYGSGFPKNLDVSKAIDKAAGAERKVVGQRTDGRYAYGHSESAKKALGAIVAADSETGFSGEVGEITEAATPEAKQWEGFGTALKPAHEPVVMARKPLVGTVVANVLEFGTGAINIAGCQIGFASQADEEESKGKNQHGEFGSATGTNKVYGDFSMVPKPDYDAPGRWPANVILCHGADCELVGYTEVESDGHYPGARGPSGYGSNGNFPESTGGGLKGHEDLEERHTAGEVVEVWECAPGCPVAILNAQSGVSKSSGTSGIGAFGTGVTFGEGAELQQGEAVGFGDVGGAARFFYVAKSSRAEREAGLRGELPCLVCGDLNSHTHPAPTEKDPDRREECRRNGHPTVKPIDLDRQLVRLVTPPGGLVLIPFLGSGSEGCAAVLDGFEVVGIEREDGSEREDGTKRENYTQLAALRIEWWEQHRGREAEAVLKASRRVERKAKERRESGQLGLELT